MTAACTESECGKPTVGRGLCGTHYAFHRRHGTLPPLAWASGCSVDGCEEKHEARGLCNKHYQRLRNTGTLNQPIATSSDAERFWSKVDKSGGEFACWPWTAGICTNTGYGNVWWDGKTRSAHRISYQLTYGPIPDRMTVDHVKRRGCTMRSCVNPAHLQVVTQQVNNARGTSPSAINRQKTHCLRGHEFTPENTYYHPKRKTRNCRACLKLRASRYVY